MSSERNISSFTLIVSFLALALAGVAFLPLLPVKLAPSRTLPGLSINFSMPNNSARIVEMEATSKLEAMLARISGIKKISSYSGNGWGSIHLEFDRHADIDAARFEASTIIRQTWPQLPEETSFPVIEPSRPDENASRPFLSYTLNAVAAPIVIQQYAEKYIRPKLSQLPDVYRIQISGASAMEWRMVYDSRQLESLGITTDDIVATVKQYFSSEFLGYAVFDTGKDYEHWIRLSLVPETKTERLDPALISLTSKEGKIIRLDQLVKVTYEEEDPQSYFRINGLNSIYISLYANDGANQLELGKMTKEAVNEIVASLPQGYQMNVSYDATDYIYQELNKIYERTGLTILILLLFVLLVTFSFRYTLMVTISLIINICIAIGLYYLLRLEIQLYSLTGITISLNLIIDNTIVMAEHIRHRGNRKAFMPILAATLTTIGALSVIFFLDEKIRLNLQDFATVVIINLVVSLFIALFFIPSLMEKLGIEKRKVKRGDKRGWRKRFILVHKKRWIVYFNRFYGSMIRILSRWRWACLVVLILAFGLPTFLLPEKLEGETKWVNLYNSVFSNEIYQDKIKPFVDKGLGGTLRLFAEKVYEGSYFSQPEETVLTITASLPNGATLSQMDNLVRQMEIFLTGYDEIRQFQTSIESARRASINVFFKKEFRYGSFPYQLKAQVISKALQLGGGSWGVYGLADLGFSNSTYEYAGSYEIIMRGYNYDDLYSHAEALKARLLSYIRIQEVQIASYSSWYKDDYIEYHFDLDKQQLAYRDIRPTELFASIYPVFGKNIPSGTLSTENGTEQIKLLSRQGMEYDIWGLQNIPQKIGNKSYKLSELASISKRQAPQQIAKEDQQYRLCLQYEYVGSAKQGKKISQQVVDEFSKSLPIGYSAEYLDRTYRWDKKDHKQYLLIGLVIAIIFFISSILFNSLRQPLVVIFVIPISYIGVFLTFYWFHLNFDQGGFAAFILLCGITVNSSIYILNEYNSIRRKNISISPLRAYLKAWNLKITPIVLTILSTVLGFIPFLIGEDKEAFWFPLAAGTIGGLVMSLVGIFFYLPLFMDIKGKRKMNLSSNN